jgi:ribosome-associated protein
MNERDGLEKARVIVDAALERKAEDILVLDVRGLTSFADVFVLLTGRSDRQVRSIADNIARTLKSWGDKPIGVEGMDDGRWVLLDCNDVVVHAFEPDTREHYDLERLWDDAPRIEIEGATADGGDAPNAEAGDSIAETS